MDSAEFHPGVEREGDAEWKAWLLTALVFAFLFAGTVAPVWSNDLFWHLAAGRWMVDHHALPEVDPLAVASGHAPWIDGEWLFQVLAYAAWRVVGFAGIGLLRALGLAAALGYAFRKITSGAGPFVAFCVTVLAWYGAAPWFRERPSAAGILLFVAYLVALEDRNAVRRLAVTVAIAVVWINVHPSALLAPLVAGIAGTGTLVEEGTLSPRVVAKEMLPALLAAIALLANPYGLQGLMNPFHVAHVAQLPVFRNEEWEASSLLEFKLLAVAFVGVAVALVTSARRRRWIGSMLLLLVLGVLALRFSRNQGLFYVAAPFLLAPHLRPLPSRIRWIIAVPVAVTALAIFANSPFSTGVDRRRFPVAAVSRVRALGLPGNILAPYGTGGYLVWSFYPERRVLVDGRNELFVDFWTERRAATRSSAAWQAFMKRWEVALAFVPIESSVTVRNGATGERQRVPEWDVYYPDSEWALVAADPVDAVFARRDRTSAEVLAKAGLRRGILGEMLRERVNRR